MSHVSRSIFVQKSDRVSCTVQTRRVVSTFRLGLYSELGLLEVWRQKRFGSHRLCVTMQDLTECAER